MTHTNVPKVVPNLMSMFFCFVVVCFVVVFCCCFLLRHFVLQRSKIVSTVFLSLLFPSCLLVQIEECFEI